MAYPLDTRGFFPDNTPNPALENIAKMLERDKERRYEIDYRKQKDKEADDYRKFNILKDTIDPSDVATGNASADDYFNQETKRVFNEVTTDEKLMKLPYADFYAALQSKWQPLVQSAGKIKNGLAQIDATVKAAGTEDTNLATDKLAPDAKLKFMDEIMPFDPQSGKRTYNTSNFNPDRNHVIDILNSDDYWRYMKGADPLIKYIKDYKTEDVNMQKNLPDQSILPIKGKKSPFSKLNVTPNQFGVIKNTEIPKFEIETEDDFITDDNGNQIPLKVIDKEVYKSHIEDIPANKRSLDFLWNSFKGKNNIQSKNATEEEKRKRAFAVGVFQTHDPSQIAQQNQIHLPRNTTNNYIGGAGGNINDVYGRMYKKLQENADKGYIAMRFNSLDNDEQALVKTATENAGYEIGAGGRNVFLAKGDNNEMKIYKTGKKGEIVADKLNEISSLSFVGGNWKAQATAKGRESLLKEQQEKKNQQPSIPSGTRAEWKASGWTDAQIDEAVKSKKIIVKQ